MALFKPSHDVRSLMNQGVNHCNPDKIVDSVLSDCERNSLARFSIFCCSHYPTFRKRELCASKLTQISETITALISARIS